MAGVSAQDVVGAAYQLLEASYRRWFVGDPIPMWRKDGVGAPLTPAERRRDGSRPGRLRPRKERPPTGRRDPDTPGEPGAIAFRPYEGPSQAQQGSIALYVGEHQLIQANPEAGVTDGYTDQETFSWGAQNSFTGYGFLPGVSY